MSDNKKETRDKKFETADAVRLNKFISHNTKYSRREADRLIAQGRVTVDGAIVTDMATKVIERVNKVSINGKKSIWVENDRMFTVIVYNKPKGELVTKRDPQGRKTIYDSLSSKYRHFLPIGRLDYASEGLILLTDDVKVANALMHSQLERIYKIKINGSIPKIMISAMEQGLYLEDATKGAHKESDITSMNFAPFIAYQIQTNNQNYSKLKVAIGEGKNRELRRFFAHFNRDILDLKRLEFGGISLNNLPTGKSRYLNRDEYRNLRKYLEELEKEKNE